MSETKFTPRPWRVCNGYGRVWIDAPDTKYSERDREYTRIILGADDYEDCKEVRSADAHLIAAAPDLYEALDGLLADITEYQEINFLGGENNHWQVRARAALAKARGEG